MNLSKPRVLFVHEKHYVPPDLIPDWSMDHIYWVEAIGPSGYYERGDLENNLENQDFNFLLEDLAMEGGKMVYDNYFIWRFKDSLTIGRKKKNDENL